MKNKLVGILIIVMLIAIVPVSIFAYSGINTNITIGGSGTGADKASVDITNRVVGILQTAGTVISVVALIIIGMRYMLSSVQEKAQMKGVIGYYITGCVLVFATSNVLGLAYNVIDDVKHNWEVKRTEPTCTTAGKVYSKCKDCGEDYETILPALGHSYGGWTQQSPATCTEAEVEKRTCTRSNCDAFETKNGDSAYGHNWHQLTSGENIETYKIASNATCTSRAKYYKTCLNGCNASDANEIFEYGDTLEHDFSKKVASASALYLSGNCTSKQKFRYTCSRCPAISSIDLIWEGEYVHNYVIMDMSKEYAVNGNIATCQSDGEYYYKCSCGAKGTNTYVVEKSDSYHVWGGWGNDRSCKLY